LDIHTDWAVIGKRQRDPSAAMGPAHADVRPVDEWHAGWRRNCERNAFWVGSQSSAKFAARRYARGYSPIPIGRHAQAPNEFDLGRGESRDHQRIGRRA